MRTMNRELSDWIRDLRTKTRLSLYAASRQLRLSPTLLWSFENGGSIPLRYLLEIVRFYGVDGSELMSRMMGWQRRVRLGPPEP